MRTATDRKLMLWLLLGSCLLPLAVMWWNVGLGALLLVLDLIFAMRWLQMLRSASLESLAADDAAAQAQSSRGRTIFVQLVDDQGRELDAATARARLEEAQRSAGPRDHVVGVRRKLDS